MEILDLVKNLGDLYGYGGGVGYIFAGRSDSPFLF